MNVIALRQLAVFMNAGSYVINPKSSGPVLICRRSMARTVPLWIGSSYFFPVRLSVIERVSGIGHYSSRTGRWLQALGSRRQARRAPEARRPEPEARSPKSELRMTIAGVVPDVAGRDDEDDVFGDVGGVIADSFEVPRDENQVQRGLDRR